MRTLLTKVVANLRSGLSVILFIGAITICASAIGGISFSHSLRAGFIVSFQIVAGVQLVRAWFPGRLSFLGLLGIGGTLGIGLFTLASVALVKITPHSVWWVIPFLVWIILALLLEPPTEEEMIGVKQGLGFLAPVTLGVIALLPFWRNNSVTVNGWREFYGDLFYHEALSNGIARNGIVNLTILDDDLRYHWLADAFAGFLSLDGGLATFETLGRFLPIFAVILSAAVSWEIGRSFSQSTSAVMVAASVTTLAGAIGLSVAMSYPFLSAEWSPTHSFGAPFLLSQALVFTRIPSLSSFGWRGASLSFAMAFLLLLSRAPQALIALVGLLGVTLALTRNRTVFRRLALAGVSTVLGVASAYFLLVSGGPANGLVFEPNAEVISAFALTPVGTSWGTVLALPSVAIAVGAALAGVWGIPTSAGVETVIARAWVSYTFVFGLLVSIFVSQPGGSEITFVWAGVLAGLPFSGVGLAMALGNAKGVSGSSLTWKIRWLLVLGVALGAVAVLLHEISLKWPMGGYLRWSVPLAVVGLSVFLSFRGNEPWSTLGEEYRRRIPVALLLVSASLSASLTGVVARMAIPPEHATSDTPLALSDDYLTAGTWVRTNTPFDALFATDRQCGSLANSSPPCGSTWSGPAALGARQTLLETASYSLGESGEWSAKRLEDMERSWRFGTKPSVQDHCYLWAKGVRWFWSDARVSSLSPADWEPWGSVKFSNPAVTVIELSQPKC